MSTLTLLARRFTPVPVVLGLLFLAGCGDDGSPSPTQTTGGNPPPPISVHYGFSSNTPRTLAADAFAWPPSPPGMIDDFPSTSFTTPDGVTIFHDIGNNLFFDDAYLLPDQAAQGTGIEDDAMWGQPRPTSAQQGIIEAVIIQFAAAVDSVGFDFNWAISGSAAPAVVEVAVSEQIGGGEFVSLALPNSYDAGAVFGNSLGRSGRVGFTLASLADAGINLSGIRMVTIFVDVISTQGSTSAFAVDNFTAISPGQAPPQ